MAVDSSESEHFGHLVPCTYGSASLGQDLKVLSNWSSSEDCLPQLIRDTTQRWSVISLLKLELPGPDLGGRGIEEFTWQKPPEFLNPFPPPGPGKMI